MYNPDIESLSPTELDDLVLKRVRHTLRYAAEHSDYWTQRFESDGLDPENINDDEDLLVLDPMDGDDYLARQPPHAEDLAWMVDTGNSTIHAVCTSGTTGIEKWVAVNEDDAEISNDAVRRGYVASQVDEQATLVNLLPMGPYLSGKQSREAANNHVGDHIALGHWNIPPRDRTLATFADTRLEPDAVFGSPSSVEKLARELAAHGIEPASLGLESIMLVGEASDVMRRESIRDAFGDPVVTNNFATTESGFAAYESPDCDVEGMHVIEDLRLLLVVNEDERRLAEQGELGSVWITSLYPEGKHGASPLINYKTGDLARNLGRRQCACGRTHRMITDVTRIDNAIEVHQSVTLTPKMAERIIHREEFRPVLSGEYIIEISSSEIERDTITIRAEAANSFQEDESLVTSGAQLEEKLVETFRREHVTLDALTAGNHLAVQAEITDPGEIQKEFQGKPDRIRVFNDQ